MSFSSNSINTSDTGYSQNLDYSNGQNVVNVPVYNDVEMRYNVFLPRGEQSQGKCRKGEEHDVFLLECRQSVWNPFQPKELEAQGPCVGHRSIIAILHCFSLVHEKYIN